MRLTDEKDPGCVTKSIVMLEDPYYKAMMAAVTTPEQTTKLLSKIIALVTFPLISSHFSLISLISALVSLTSLSFLSIPHAHARSFTPTCVRTISSKPQRESSPSSIFS